MTAHEKRGMWVDIGDLLRCDNAWPVKHYSTVFVKAYYIHRLKNCPVAQHIVHDVATKSFLNGNFNVPNIREAAIAKLPTDLHIFPLEICNSIYHLLNDFRK